MLFNRFAHLGDADRFLFPKRTAEARERLSRSMGRYWASFARDGHPSCARRPDWPVYGKETGTFLRFDTGVDAILPLVEVDSVERLAADLRSDDELTAEQRLRVVDELERWMCARPIRPSVLDGLGLSVDD